MGRKVTTSVSFRIEQLQWIDEQDGSASETVRRAVDEYMEESNDKHD